MEDFIDEKCLGNRNALNVLDDYALYMRAVLNTLCAVRFFNIASLLPSN